MGVCPGNLNATGALDRNTMRKLNTKASFALVIALLVIPILLLGWLFVEQSNKDISFAKKELKGLAYISTIFPLLTKTDESIDEWTKLSDSFLQARDEYDDVFGTNPLSTLVQEHLRDGNTQSPEFMDSLQTLISQVGDQSNLILDPDLDSYYLMDAAILRTPKLILELENLEVAIKSSELTDDANASSHVQAILAVERLRGSLTALRASLGAAMLANQDGSIDTGLTDKVQAVVDKIDSLIEKSTGSKALSQHYTLNSGVAKSFMVSPIRKEVAAVFVNSANSLENLLTSRINRFQTKLNWALSLCSAVALLALALSFGVFRSILNTLDDRIVFLAEHDSMTELRNRAAFSAAFEENKLVAADKGKNFAIHVIDLDGFKVINDTLGHQAGDNVLKSVAKTLLELSSVYDSVARFGGDEFVIIQANVASPRDAEVYGKRIVQSLHIPIEVSGASAQLSASVGTTIFRTHGYDETQLMRRAEIALYNSKMRGKNRATLFNTDMEHEHERRLGLELEVRRATENKSFTLAYQPQYDVKANQVTGFEALLRLTSEAGEPISPAIFIPVVEKLGLICEVGSWVLKRACQTARTWPDNIQVAVNLSPLQFTSGDAVAAIESAIKDSGLPANRLQIEITESTLLESTDLVIRDLNRIKALGVSIAMDDFGTGYSSLSYLWKFPFDKIKIDRSFVADIGPNKSDARTILHTIISLGHSMSMTVTVEGVETEEQARAMAELDCDQVQGYHYSRPIPEPGLPSFLLHSMVGNMNSGLIEGKANGPLDFSAADGRKLLN